MDLKVLGIGVIIGIIALFGVLLHLGSSSSLGGINNPYNSSLGYQGTGYYLYNSHKFYSVNVSQFNQNIGKTNSSSSTTNSIPESNYTKNQTQPVAIKSPSPLICNPSAGFSCTNGLYNYSTSMITVTLSQDSGFNWNTTQIFYVNQSEESSVEAMGANNSLPHTTLQDGMLNAQSVNVNLPTKTPSAGYIWVSYTTQQMRPGSLVQAQIADIGTNITTLNQNTTTGNQCSTQNTAVYVGSSLSCGPFQIVLSSLTSSTATVKIYDNGVLTNESTILANTEAEFDISGTPLYVVLLQIYSSEELADLQAFTVIISYTNLTSSSSPT